MYCKICLSSSRIFGYNIFFNVCAFGWRINLLKNAFNPILDGLKNWAFQLGWLCLLLLKLRILLRKLIFFYRAQEKLSLGFGVIKIKTDTAWACFQKSRHNQPPPIQDGVKIQTNYWLVKKWPLIPIRMNLFCDIL